MCAGILRKRVAQCAVHWCQQFQLVVQYSLTGLSKRRSNKKHVTIVCVCVVLLKVQDVAVAQQMWAALFSSVVSGRISSDEEAEVRR